jgi:pyruvate/2-oxoglutarate dehydrogenase complex dihydrolipoamide acyltransferase (E2) component
VGKVALTKVKKDPIFRKIAMGTWKTAKDPSVYGQVEIDLTETFKYLEEYKLKHDVKITPAHLIGRAVTYCMRRRPEVNGMIRGSRIYRRKHVSLFYQVNIQKEGDDAGKANLSGTVIHKAEELTLAGLADALKKQAKDIREDKDIQIKKSTDMFKIIPWFLIGLWLDFVSWLIYGLNIDLSFADIPQDPFGSIMITNVGGMGIDMAWAPLVPYSRVPLLMCVGAVTDKAVVVDGKIEIRPMLPIGITFDHRLIDGAHAGAMAYDFKKCFAEPEKFLFNDELEMPNPNF